MRKFLMLLSTSLVAVLTPLGIVNTNKNISQINLVEKTPDWVHKMSQNNSGTINIGYDHYYLVNKKTDKTDPWQQYDWVDLNTNNNLYLYLPQANNITEAVQEITIDDSASPKWTIGIEEPVTWKKVNETTYTNKSFITEDTTINGNALMDIKKYQEIKTGKKALTTWTADEKKWFSETGSFPGRPTVGQQDWWNSNGWEKLLRTKNDLPNNHSQKELYDKWIGQSGIGMNVPLSLINENSFTIKTTDLNHVFLLQNTIKEAWIDNTGNVINIPKPHWGFTLKLNYKNQTIFQTPQLLKLDNAFNESDIVNYLFITKGFWSFNSQEQTKFKANYIA